MKVEGQKSSILEGLTPDLPILTATLLAVCLGGAAAWATTGVFSVVAFVIAAALGLAVQVGICRLKPYLPWLFAPLLVIAVYWSQVERLDWAAVWPALIVAAMWVQRVPVAARFGNRGYLIPYGILLIGITVGGIPVWCLLCLLPAPLAWRMVKSADETTFGEWTIVTGVFLIVGYLIKGLIR